MNNLDLAWQVELFGSGTVIVRSRLPQQPHYYVCHPAADNEGEHLRYETACELRDWLNGQQEPWWLELVRRDSAGSVVTPHGSRLLATGPTVDATGSQHWVQDESPDARIARGILAEALAQRRRLCLDDQGQFVLGRPAESEEQ